MPDPRKIFKIGTMVKIRTDSRFSHQNRNPGKIVGGCDTDGWMAVKFSNGNSNHYRIGLPSVDGGACDLELYFEDPKIDFIGSLLNWLTTGSKSSLEISPADLEKIEKEGTVQVKREEIEIKIPSGIIMFYLQTGHYSVFKVDGTEIPFHEICRGSAKTGIAQFIGHQKFYPAYAIISKWLKGGVK